jgi:hypothetical protein
MVCLVWQDDNGKALIDIITEFFLEDTRARAKTVTISQAAFMQPSKVKERHYFYRHSIDHFKCRSPDIPRWNGRNLSY